ncbi:NIPSNAP family protein [Pseudoprimorskyibacter insulae]|uniref:NIPSNAP domain-containing protein n=1 Tax=Pseudoprimorskyibacter insulae TaxID=1695997 RepID=A0A2R8AY51_9RHOB|nr:NIPSNAP family protein [Pseudoprimorskyibacter insulae]SPF80930.1 hypothetical protein PRI8871_02743 [Pseudoprimorskyibacter insulae]
MLLELRTYDMKPGKAPAYLTQFRTQGVGLVTRHLPMLGYWLVDTGRLNRIEHLWAYASFEERDACRASLAQDAEWMEGFIPTAFEHVVAQSNRLMQIEKSSPALKDAIAQRKAHHANQAADSPMLAQSLHALEVGANPDNGVGLIGQFRVVSGDCPGQIISLRSGAFADLCTAATGSLSQEILRPLSLSPLR